MTRKNVSKILMISPEKCLGCRSCELACSFNKTNEFNPKHSAVSVITYDEAAISVPVMCMQCEDAACIKVCPVGATKRDENGAVVVDEKICIGCKICVSVCPLGNMSFNSIEKKVIKCNLCGGSPKCEQICPSGAIQYKEGTEANLSKKKIIAEKFKQIFGEVDA
jgi:anaerobic carbon-monoxide dehydrogenase iron sulfur subunit